MIQKNLHSDKINKHPYLYYKDSGVEWLGKIPERWDVLPLKILAPLVNRGNSPEYVDVSNVKVINQACIQWSGLNLDNVKYQYENDVQDWRGLLQLGDILINSTGTGTLGRVSLFNVSGTFIADSHVTIIRVDTKIVEPRYLYYLIRASLYQGYIYSAIVAGSTNQIELSREGLRDTPIIVPPLSEQRIIADFLDHEIACIDSLIGKYKRLIGLLEEKKIALIAQVVLKGLNKYAPMKEVELPWIKRIPAYWDIIRNGNLFIERDERNSQELPLLNVSIHTGVTLREFSDEHIEQMASDWSTYKVARKGDIAFNKMRMWQGAVGVTPEDGLVSPDYTVACPRKNVNPRYFEYLFRTDLYKNEINRFSHGIVPDRNRLYWEQFKQMPSLCPPLEEQNKIVDYLDLETGKLAQLIIKIQKMIKLLQEYRITLISSAITGKIDLREE